MKIALVFPGYGSQYVGMGKELYDEYRIVQEYFEEASSCSNVNFVKLCFASSDSELSKLANAYMSLFLVGSSVFAILKEQNIIPEVVTGYNNGEITALFSGGCFSLPDGLYLLNKFASFYEEAMSAMDVAVLRVTGKTTKEVEAACRKIGKKDILDIAFYDGQKDHIVVGISDAMSQLYTALEVEDGVMLEYFSAEVGLHSHFMNEVIDQFKIYLEKVDFKDLTIPMISGIDGATVTSGEEIKERFIKHFVVPCHFIDIVHRLHDYDVIIVATPALRLGKILKDSYPDKHIVMIEKKSDIEALVEMVQTKQKETE